MDSKHSDDDYIINDTEYEEDEADIAFDKQEKSKKKGSVIRRIILIICIIYFQVFCDTIFSRYAHKDTARV